MSSASARHLLPVLLCLPLLLIAVPLPAMAGPVPVTAKSRAAEASQAALGKLAPNYPGLNATVFVKGQKVWSSSLGQSDMAKTLPVTDATRFNIYSTTKALTGMAFARLIAEGRVTLDTTAGEIDPGLPEPLKPIRIKDILSHTSGLRHYTPSQDWLKFAQLHCDAPADALPYFENDPLVATPGSAEHYSSYAFVLASHLLVRITGARDFETALNTTLGHWAHYELDRPGRMKSVPYIHARDLPVLPAGAVADDIVPSPLPDAGCKFGGGGIIASSSELAQSGAMLAAGRIIPKAKLTAALRPWSAVSGVVYGGGIKTIATAHGNVTSYSLSGGAPGGRSYLLVLVEPQIAVAITGNMDGPEMADTAAAIAQAW